MKPISKPDGLEITPLGAAIVEAMPDRKKMSRIKSDFKKRRVCPTSEIFHAVQVVEFYRARGETITPS